MLPLEPMCTYLVSSFHYSHGKLEIAKYFVEQLKTDANVQDRNRWTPLHLACWYVICNSLALSWSTQMALGQTHSSNMS